MSIHFQQDARPYAVAAFAWAQQHQTEADWHSVLQTVAQAFSSCEAQGLLGDPRVDQQRLVAALVQDFKAMMDGSLLNFLSLLAEQRRLNLLPAISVVFDTLFAAAKRYLAIEVCSAFALSPEQQQRLQKKLADKYNKEVHLQCSEDPSLLGGLRIKMGDEVIDASIRGKLQQLALQLR